jgi:hyperosmotically inducible periplasmic protein
MNKFSLLMVMPALLTGGVVTAQTASHDSASSMTPSAAVAPDNTKSNKSDPSNRGMTADKQTNASADIDLTKRIRQSVMADSSLSTYAHNVKIVAVAGRVTLNGVVSSADEKMQIGKKATAIAGEGHVVDELKVAPKK